MIKEQKTTVQIKGIKDGLLVTLGEGEWLELQNTFLQHIQERSAFFSGAKVAVDVGDQNLQSNELSNLRDRLSEFGVSLWAILSRSPETEQTAHLLGLSTRLAKTKPDQPLRPLLDGETALFIHRTLRSGHKIEYQGHILIVGDVNPGAEVIASGNVFVWGRLRGVVHAGVEGNERAIVCALDLSPMQLRIATYISIPPKRKEKTQPEIAQVIEGHIVADPWEYRDGGL